MKVLKLKYAALAAAVLVGGAAAVPLVSHAVPISRTKPAAPKQASSATKTAASSELLSYWQYPRGVSYGAQLAVVSSSLFPDCLQGTTHDPIEKAYAFYRQKATDGLGVEHGFNWETNVETVLLVNQPMIGGNPSGGIGFTGLGETRHNPDHNMMIIHQPTQTVIVKLSRDAQNQSWTDITVIVDKH